MERKEEIELWISQARPKVYICRKLNCKQDTLNSYLKKMGIIYKGNMGGLGHNQSPSRKKASEYLFEGSTINSHKLKLKLLEDNLKRKVCEKCELEKWLGESIPLELHHKNGNKFDNRLNNLQLLCPNCHALTDNYSGRKTIRN